MVNVANGAHVKVRFLTDIALVSIPSLGNGQKPHVVGGSSHLLQLM